MPQLKCELSKEDLEDFEQMMDEVGIKSRYGMLKILVNGALDTWRKEKFESRGIREKDNRSVGESRQTTERPSGTDKAKRRIF